MIPSRKNIFNPFLNLYFFLLGTHKSKEKQYNTKKKNNKKWKNSYTWYMYIVLQSQSRLLCLRSRADMIHDAVAGWRGPNLSETPDLVPFDQPQQGELL